MQLKFCDINSREPLFNSTGRFSGVVLISLIWWPQHPQKHSVPVCCMTSDHFNLEVRMSCVAQWLALHSHKVLGSVHWPGPPHACVGSVQILRLPPTVQRYDVSLISHRCDWAWMVTCPGCTLPLTLWQLGTHTHTHTCLLSLSHIWGNILLQQVKSDFFLLSWWLPLPELEFSS